MKTTVSVEVDTLNRLHKIKIRTRAKDLDQVVRFLIKNLRLNHEKKH